MEKNYDDNRVWYYIYRICICLDNDFLFYGCTNARRLDSLDLDIPTDTMDPKCHERME